MRSPLTKKTQLILNNYNNGEPHTYIIEGTLPGSDTGASCLCYIATRNGESQKTVVLKEFYPDNDTYKIVRNDDNSLNIQELINSISMDSNLYQDLSTFKKSNEYLKKYLDNSQTSGMICASDNTGFLVGNGSFYYENRYYPESENLLKCAQNAKIKADELVQIMIGYNRFLKKLHEFPNLSGHGDALVDIKPDDVLVTKNENAELPDYGNPKFFDFGGVLELDQTYPLSQIKSTPAYCPDDFDSSKSKTGVAEVTLHTEHYSFSRVMNKILFEKDKKKGLSTEVKNIIENRIMKPLSDKSLTDEMLDNGLIEARDQFRLEEKELKGKYIEFKKIVMYFVRALLFILTTGMYIGMAIIMGYMCANPELSRTWLRNFGISDSYIILILCGVTLLLSLMKFGVFLLNRYILRIQTSIQYFDEIVDGKSVNTGEFNTFRYGITRYKTTYKDISSANRRRQLVRRICWISLGTIMVLSLVLSILIQSFPIFVILSLFAIIFQMFVDHFMAMVDYYDKCSGEDHRKLGKLNSTRKQKAAYYLYEYNKTKKDGVPFALESEYYKMHTRNIFTMRKELKKQATGSKEPDLDFTPLIIKNIYKMAFDRIKNTNLILTIAILIGTLSAIFIDYASFMGKWKTFFRLQDNSYKYVVLILIVIFTIANIYQIIVAFSEEALVAEFSYKSRFILDFALNHYLVEDIIGRKLKKIDIVRGINQSEAIIASKEREINEYRKTDIDRLLFDKHKPYNTKLLHHNLIGDRQRLWLTLLMGWGIVFSAFIWLGNMYFLAIPSVILAVALYFVIGYVFIPRLTRSITVKTIERLLNEQENSRKAE